MANKTLPFLAVIFATAIGATGGLFIKGSVFSSLALGGFRTLIPIIFLLPIIIRRKALKGAKENRRLLWSASVINAGRLLLYILAFKLTAMGNAVVIFYTWPVFTMLIHSVQLKRRPGFREVFVLLIAFTGAIIMNLHRDFGSGYEDILGSLSMLGASLLYSLHNVLMKKGLDSIDEIEGLYFQNAAGALILLPLLLIELPSASMVDMGLGALYALVVGLIAFWLFYYALKRLSLVQYGSLAYLEILFAILYGTLFLKEQLGVNMLIGGLLVIASSYSAKRLDARLTG